MTTHLSRRRLLRSTAAGILLFNTPRGAFAQAPATAATQQPVPKRPDPLAPTPLSSNWGASVAAPTIFDHETAPACDASRMPPEGNTPRVTTEDCSGILRMSTRERPVPASALSAASAPA